MAHIHEVIDMDKHFVIDPATRIITNATPEKKTIMQYDHNSERYTFELPRYIDGHDMFLCNVVQVHYIDISPDKRTQKVGVYEVEDLQLASSDEGTDDIVLCSWLISQNATQIYGILNFLVRYTCTTDGTLDYAWNTGIFSGITVSNGIYNGPAIAEEYADILEQWRQQLFSGSGSGGSVTVDSVLSTTSTNPVQNKVVTAELQKKGTVKTVNGTAPDAAGNVAISVGSGTDAREIELQKNDTAIQWRYTGEEAWTNLVPLADITGPAGAAGAPGKDGQDGSNGTDGQDGGYYTPAVSAEGYLSWVASKDGMPEMAGTNIKGPEGPVGPTGKDGTDGNDGSPGAPGAPGKSAYQYAQDGGYAGTEEAFAAKLAAEYAEITERIAMTSTDTTAQLQPGKLYVFPEMASLSLTFAAPVDTGIANEYHCIFTSGATATELILPDGISVGGLTVDANKTYELSILENCLTWQSWDYNTAEVTA